MCSWRACSLGSIPGDVLIAASGLRDKDQILERMKEHQQQQQAQAQQAAGQLAQPSMVRRRWRTCNWPRRRPTWRWPRSGR